MAHGRFITFEGMDGCGKTTQLRVLAADLRARGLSVTETVEPGGTEIGQQIRRILLDPANTAIHSRTELLLYFASRAQNVEQVIKPALAQGGLVLCDRFTDSTLVYQGCGRGLPAATVLQLDGIACEGVRPDLTVLIDIDLETSRPGHASVISTTTFPSQESTTRATTSMRACGPGIWRWRRRSRNALW